MAEEHTALVAAELAHEVRNVIQVVQTVGTVLLREAQRLDKDAGLLLQDLLACSARATLLARRLMVLAREELAAPPTNLSTAVANEVAAVRRIAPVNVSVTSDIESGLVRTMLANRDVQQIMLNMATNAFDAMPDGGMLRIALRRHDGHAELTITDSGAGMDTPTRDHCFELFFTTKPGTGTGVGLFSVRTAIERVGGRIHVESTPGKGTTFLLVVPIVDDHLS